MNCSQLTNCFHNQTLSIIADVSKRVVEMSAPGVIRNTRFIAPVIISIGIFDHIRRALNLDNEILNPNRLNLRDFDVCIFINSIFAVSGVPVYFNWGDGPSSLLTLQKEILELDICTPRIGPPFIVDELDVFEKKINVQSNYFGSYYLSLIAISAALFAVVSIHNKDLSRNRIFWFRAHKLNYYITYISLAALLAFQTYLLYRFDLRYPSADLQGPFFNCANLKILNNTA